MQIACPACAATYQVPDAMIGAGRQMRCVRCGEDWFAQPPAPDVATAASPPPAEDPAPREVPPPPIRPLIERAPAASVAPPARSSSGLLLLLAWLVSLGLWSAGLYALWALRDPLAELWPPLGRLYALFGLA